MTGRQQSISRRQFLTTLGVLAAGTAALAACGTAATPTAAPVATTAPVASTAPAATATTAPAAAASSAPSAAASSAPATAASTAPTAAVSTATRASTATAAAPGTRTTATASAAAAGEGDVPNGNYGGSKYFSVVVDQKVEISSVAGALRWDKAQYTAKAGDVTFVTKNQGPMPHQLGIEGNGIKYESANLAPNTTTNLTIKGLKAGEYDVVCNVGNHKAQGMVAKLMVS
jgi:uncharacterized cupredoxin-like copper-binding protein